MENNERAATQNVAHNSWKTLRCGTTPNSALERDVSQTYKQAYNPLWLLITQILAAIMTKFELLAWKSRFSKYLYTIN